MIFCHSKVQLLTLLSMWQGGHLTSFREKEKKEEEEKVKVKIIT
jgi:hypothetical protein